MTIEFRENTLTARQYTDFQREMGWNVDQEAQ